MKKILLTFLCVFSLLSVYLYGQRDEGTINTVIRKNVDPGKIQAIKKDLLAFEKAQGKASNQNETNVSIRVDGLEEFKRGFSDLFNWMATNKILFRHQLKNAFDKSLNATEVKPEEVNWFNAEVNAIVLKSLSDVPRLQFRHDVLNDLKNRLRSLENPFVAIKTSMPLVVNKKSTLDVQAMLQKIDNLDTEEMTTTHASNNPIPSSVFYGLVGLSLICAFFLSSMSQTKKVISTDKNAVKEPLKKIVETMDQPVVICRTDYSITFSNNIAKELMINSELLWDLLGSEDPEQEKVTVLNGKRYLLDVVRVKREKNELFYIVHFKPQLLDQRFLEHFANPSEVERIFQQGLAAPDEAKNLNQVIVENSLKLNYLFKTSDKTLDLDLDPTMNENFVDSKVLSVLSRDFISASFHLIKDQAQVSGIYLRTQETGERLRISAFLPNLTESAFENIFECHDFIHRLGLLESQFNLLKTSVSFRWVSSQEVSGLDINLAFDNRSELETVLNSSESFV
jgi:hypothetical protein